MLKNIPPILSPELLKVLCEMGHGDRICIGDGNYPGASTAREANAVFIRADGHGIPDWGFAYLITPFCKIRLAYTLVSPDWTTQ